MDLKADSTIEPAKTLRKAPLLPTIGYCRVIGKETLDRIESDLKIRGEIALKTAQASSCLNDREFMKKCWYEAYYSNSTIPNYLRLFTDGEVIREYKDLAEKKNRRTACI